MFIQNISLFDFKNYSTLNQDFSPSINCFLGQNGAGKTNLLDAIHYLCLCKSYFNAIDSQNIIHGGKVFKLEGIFNANDTLTTITCKVAERQKKQFSNNNTRYNRLSEHVGMFPVVIITPDDMTIINGGSDERRKSMDNTLAQIDHQYLQDLMNYNKVLLQRNATLKKFSEQQIFDGPLLEGWDIKLIELGQKIHERRKIFLQELSSVFQKNYEAISNKNEVTTIEYRSDLNKGNYGELIKESRNKDLVLQRTSVGIHRDDIIFHIDDYLIRKFGSQGQKKSFLIAFKLALYETIRKEKQVAPILLLDDIFDKLDRKRIQQLLSIITADEYGQIFLTDTNEGRVDDVFKELKAEIMKFTIESNKIQ